MFKGEHSGFIHEPARLQLMLYLGTVREVDFVFLLNATGFSKGNLSVQMRKLAARGLIAINKSFENNKPLTVYKITRVGAKALKQYRQDMRRLLAD